MLVLIVASRTISSSKPPSGQVILCAVERYKLSARPWQLIWSTGAYRRPPSNNHLASSLYHDKSPLAFLSFIVFFPFLLKTSFSSTHLVIVL